MSYKLIAYSDIDPTEEWAEMWEAYKGLMQIEFPVIVEPFNGTGLYKVPARMGIMYLDLESFVYEKVEKL